MATTTAQIASGDTVSVIMARKFTVENEGHLWQLEKQFEHHLKLAPGFLSVNHFPTTDEHDREYISIFQFDSTDNLIRWERSPIRNQLLEQVDALIEGDIRRKKIIGLEGMFEPSVAGSPPRHKMAILITLVIFTMLLILKPVVANVLDFLPMFLQLFILVSVQVSLMTYVVMPTLTRWLSNWLYQR